MSIMFSFQNGTGGPSDEAGGHYNESFMCKGVFSEVKLQEESVGAEWHEETLSESRISTGVSAHQKTPKKSSQSEICVVHDVVGVLLHHAHSRNNYTLAISAKQVTEVMLCTMIQAHYCFMSLHMKFSYGNYFRLLVLCVTDLLGFQFQTFNY